MCNGLREVISCSIQRKLVEACYQLLKDNLFAHLCNCHTFAMCSMPLIFYICFTVCLQIGFEALPMLFHKFHFIKGYKKSFT